MSLLENRCRTERVLDLSFDVERVARFRRIDRIRAEKVYIIFAGANKGNTFGVRRSGFGVRGLAFGVRTRTRPRVWRLGLVTVTLREQR
jgi:hypothetical protein